MASLKTLCVVSLGSFLAVAAGFVIASDVRAGDSEQETPNKAVDAETLARASAFAGEYTFVGGQKEQDQIDAAIEKALNEVNPMVRSLGRKRLQETNKIAKQLRIAVEGEAVDIRFDGSGHSARLDGSTVKAVSPYGDKIKISHRMRGERLIERTDSRQGGRSNTFKLGKDGKVTVDVQITSSHLPVPVEYRLTYKRK